MNTRTRLISGLAILVLIVGVVLGWMPQASAQGPREAAPTPAQGHANHTPPTATPDPAAPDVTLTGYISARHGRPEVEGDPMGMAVALTDEQGVTIDLDMDYGAAYALFRSRKQVTIKGKVISRPQNRGNVADRGRVQVTEVVAVDGKAPVAPPAPGAEAPEAEAAPQAAVTGSVPWVSVLCRFADKTGVTPRPVSYFDGLFGATAPGINHFWRQMSYGQANIDGSIVRGWYNLPHARSYYNNSDGEINLDLLAEECTKAAESSVYFPSFAGINIIINDDIGCCAWGGGAFLNRDGVGTYYSMTWMPPWAFNNQDVLAHEMGHGFGLPHSTASTSYPGYPYNNWWDVMSGGGCLVRNATYGCVGQGTIAYHRDWLGWIPAARKYAAPLGTVRAGITLERLDQPVSTSNYLMARIPIKGSSTRFYTVEARQKAGYDAALPGAGVIIHQIDTNRSDWAMVVDTNADGNSNTGDGSAIWSVGETFVDAANGIRVEVTGAPTTSSYRVVISNGTNLALNKPITGASGLCRESQPLTKAVDGTTANDSKWCSYSYGANRWLRIDLGASRAVRAVVIRHAGAGGESAGFNTRDFFIQGSADGSAWTTLATVTGNTANVTRHPVSASARYIRVEITNPSNNGDTATRLYEVEVYGY